MPEASLGASKARVTILVLMLIFVMTACVIGCSNGGASFSCSDSDSQVGTSHDCFPEPPAPAAPGKTWRVVLSEEFNGKDYDHTKLSPCFDWNSGGCTSSFNKGKETYKPEQVRVSDGTAKLVAEPQWPTETDPLCYQDKCTYKAGLLSTARPNVHDGQYPFPFTYGYVESRLKFPAIPGFFTAFWMLPTDPSYEYRSEIDILEILGGSPENVNMTYAYDDRNQAYKVNRGPNDNGACPVRDYSQDWVRFGVDWQPDHIAWYVNGVKCGEFTDAAKIENGPMQLILNLAVDNNWERDVGSVLTDQTLIAQVEVDYIRVYQQR